MQNRVSPELLEDLENNCYWVQHLLQAAFRTNQHDSATDLHSCTRHQCKICDKLSIPVKTAINLCVNGLELQGNKQFLCFGIFTWKILLLGITGGMRGPFSISNYRQYTIAVNRHLGVRTRSYHRNLYIPQRLLREPEVRQ